jgi:TolB-like protein/Tfp pilus assembly protein PilF
VTDTPSEREDEGAWAKLRRRKVVQWGIAYAAGAWGLLQVLQFLADAFEWPSQTLRLATIALAIGVPIALTLAWYHGDRGHQKPVGTELAIIALLLLLGGGVLWFYGHRSTPPETAAAVATPPPAPTATTTPADPRPSIAVLPFENRSAKQDDAYFVDGIHDDILTQLTKIGAMKVIARTSVEQFRDTKLTTKEIGEKLGVTRVLEGGVQRAGDRVRVTVQLIDTATDGHLWAENYDRELTAANIFAIQSEVATAIADTLNATLTVGEKARVAAIPTQSLEAWEAYQLGKQRVAKRTSDGLADAERFFKRAIDLDPEFALAYAGLTETYSLQTTFSGAPLDANMDKGERAAARALELDPNSAEAWVSYALIAADKGQEERAEQAFRRAIQLNPNYAGAYDWLSQQQSWLGRADEAVASAQKAADLDPLSAGINARLGFRLMDVGRIAEAEDRLRRSIDIDPSISIAYRNLGSLRAYAYNRFAEGVPLVKKAVELDPDNPVNACYLMGIYYDLGDDAAASRVEQDARRHWPDSWCIAWHWAYTSAMLGDQKSALQGATELLRFDPRGQTPLQLLGNADVEAGHPELARARYAKAWPNLVGPAPPTVDRSNYQVAIDLAHVLQRTDESWRAKLLLDRSEQVISNLPRLPGLGYGVADVQIHALRGDKAKALAALRDAEKAGWRGPFWRYYRDLDPNLSSIRNEPEFKAVFAEIERDMARQRAELAKRPKDAPLNLGESRQ